MQYKNPPEVLFLFIPKHWIRLEMQADMVISRLSMKVDPSDSSYVPSLIVMSGGDATSSLKELKTVHVPAEEQEVVLLSDVSEVMIHDESFNNNLYIVSIYSNPMLMLLKKKIFYYFP